MIATLAGLIAAAGAWIFASAIARFLEQPALGGAFGAMRWGLSGAIVAITIAWGVQTLLLVAAVLRAMKQHAITMNQRVFRELLAEKRILLTFALPSRRWRSRRW